MGAEYSTQAIDYCFKLYLKHNGQQHQLIEKEMQAAGWSGWKVGRLYNNGSKIGWIEKYGWREALAKHLEQKVAPTLNSAEKLVRDIEMVCDGLAVEIRTKSVAATDKERLQLFRDFGNLQIGAITKVQAARDTLGGWVSFFEKFIDWATDIDPRLARKLTDKSEEFIARAEKEFGD